jgi:hypothetical protein
VFGNAGGGKVPHDEYLKAHAELLARDRWIIDGFGCIKSAWERFAAAEMRYRKQLQEPNNRLEMEFGRAH